MSDVHDGAPLVGVVMGSGSDWPTMSKAAEVLERFGVRPRDAGRVRPSHARRDVRVRRSGRGAAGCGRSSPAPVERRTCPGCSRRRRSCRCSVFRSPSRHLGGHDSLLSIVQMPAGVPTATFAIGEAGATNAALFAVAMLAAADDADLAAALRQLPRGAASAGGGDRRCRRHDTDPARRHGRHARRWSARPLRADRGAHDGLPHCGARSRPAGTGEGDRRRAVRRRVRRRVGAGRVGGCGRRRHDRVREPAGGGTRVPGAANARGAVAGGGGDRPGPDPREAVPRRRRASRSLPTPSSTRPTPTPTSRIRRSSRPPGSATTARDSARSATARRCAPRGGCSARFRACSSGAWRWRPR